MIILILGRRKSGSESGSRGLDYNRAGSGGRQLRRGPGGDDLGDLGSLPVCLHKMPHLRQVHGLWLETPRKLAAEAVDSIQSHVDPLEQSRFQGFVLI